jgi:hypothetical protein
VLAGGHFNTTGAAGKTLGSDAVLNHAGTGLWTGAGNINANSGSVFNNSGVWESQTTATYAAPQGGTTPLPLFNNTGTVRKSGDASSNTTFDPNILFNNGGTVELRSIEQMPGM